MGFHYYDPRTKNIERIRIDDTSGEILLTISDRLDWSDERAHLTALRAKIDSNFRFTRYELYRHLPEARGAPVRIEVVGTYEIPESARSFFELMKEVAVGEGVTFTARQ